MLAECLKRLNAPTARLGVKQMPNRPKFAHKSVIATLALVMAAAFGEEPAPPSTQGHEQGVQESIEDEVKGTLQRLQEDTDRRVKDWKNKLQAEYDDDEDVVLLARMYREILMNGIYNGLSVFDLMNSSEGSALRFFWADTAADHASSLWTRISPTVYFSFGNQQMPHISRILGFIESQQLSEGNHVFIVNMLDSRLVPKLTSTGYKETRRHYLNREHSVGVSSATISDGCGDERIASVIGLFGDDNRVECKRGGSYTLVWRDWKEYYPRTLSLKFDWVRVANVYVGECCSFDRWRKYHIELRENENDSIRKDNVFNSTGHVDRKVRLDKSIVEGGFERVTSGGKRAKAERELFFRSEEGSAREDAYIVPFDMAGALDDYVSKSTSSPQQWIELTDQGYASCSDGCDIEGRLCRVLCDMEKDAELAVRCPSEAIQRAVVSGGRRSQSGELPRRGGPEMGDDYNAVVRIEQGNGFGSGFYISRDLVLTNYHVVYPSDFVRIVDNRGGRAQGFVVAVDRWRDLALVRSSTESTNWLTFPDVDEDFLSGHRTLGGNIRFGDKTDNLIDSKLLGKQVVAIGAPNVLIFGANTSVSAGVVSAFGWLTDTSGRLDRPVIRDYYEERIYPRAIQTDAVINLGNSGGPLLLDFVQDDVKKARRVIGMNTQGPNPGKGAGRALDWREIVAFLMQYGVATVDPDWREGRGRRRVSSICERLAGRQDGMAFEPSGA